MLTCCDAPALDQPRTSTHCSDVRLVPVIEFNEHNGQKVEGILTPGKTFLLNIYLRKEKEMVYEEDILVKIDLCYDDKCEIIPAPFVSRLSTTTVLFTANSCHEKINLRLKPYLLSAKRGKKKFCLRVSSEKYPNLIGFSDSFTTKWKLFRPQKVDKTVPAIAQEKKSIEIDTCEDGINITSAEHPDDLLKWDLRKWQAAYDLLTREKNDLKKSYDDLEKENRKLKTALAHFQKRKAKTISKKKIGN